MRFLYIDVTTDEAQFSKDFADTVLVELDKLQRKFKKQTANEKINYIDKKMILAKSELENIEENLKHFRERNRNIENSPQFIIDYKKDYKEMLKYKQGIFLTLKQQLELAKIEEVQKSSFVQILILPLTIKESNPKKRFIYILGGLVGLFLGIGFVVYY